MPFWRRRKTRKESTPAVNSGKVQPAKKKPKTSPPSPLEVKLLAMEALEAGLSPDRENDGELRVGGTLLRSSFYRTSIGLEGARPIPTRPDQAILTFLMHRLGLDAELRRRPGQEAGEPDWLARHGAEAISAVLETLERLIYLRDELAFPVPGPQFKGAIDLVAGNVKHIDRLPVDRR